MFREVEPILVEIKKQRLFIESLNSPISKHQKKKSCFKCYSTVTNAGSKKSKTTAKVIYIKMKSKYFFL